MIIPDTYEIYWDATLDDLFSLFKREYDKFWTKERLDKAASLKLSPMDVSIVASIVRCESNYVPEYPDLAGVYLNRLKLSDAKGWFVFLHDSGIKQNTIGVLQSVVRPAFEMAVDDDIIRKNPFKFKLSDVVPKDDYVRDSLTKEQQEKYLQFVQDCGGNYYDDIVILLGTGLRVSELYGLTRADIDFDRRCIHVRRQLCRTAEKTRGLCPEREECISGEELAGRIFLWDHCDSSACDKLYRRELFDGIRYPEGKTCEDIPVTYRLALKARRAVLCDRPFYNHFHIKHPVQQSGRHGPGNGIVLRTVASADDNRPLRQMILSDATLQDQLQQIFWPVAL